MVKRLGGASWKGLGRGVACEGAPVRARAHARRCGPASAEAEGAAFIGGGMQGGHHQVDGIAVGKAASIRSGSCVVATKTKQKNGLYFKYCCVVVCDVLPFVREKYFFTRAKSLRARKERVQKKRRQRACRCNGQRERKPCVL